MVFNQARGQDEENLMAYLRDVETAIDDYIRKYRRVDVAPLEMSGTYDLEPHVGEVTESISAKYPETWPHCMRRGVYFIFDASFQLLYIGKASPGIIGARLSSYFSGKDQCIIGNRWSARPRFVRALAMPENMDFEASALEAFLIKALDPTDNSIGRQVVG